MEQIKIIATDADLNDLGVIRGASATLSIGGDGTWSLSCPVSCALAGIAAGSVIYADGTELGGIVDARGTDTTEGGARATWSGRSWSGVLNSYVVRPNTGQTHYTDEGDAHEVMARLIARAGIGELFRVPDTPSVLRVAIKARYVPLWTCSPQRLKGPQALTPAAV